MKCAGLVARPEQPERMHSTKLKQAAGQVHGPDAPRALAHAAHARPARHSADAHPRLFLMASTVPAIPASSTTSETTTCAWERILG